MKNSIHNDDIPNYSTQALCVLNEFYDCDCMLFVEGKDDEIFWDNICKLLHYKSIRIENVGGREQLEDRIDMLLTETTTFLVACDMDYSIFWENRITHPQLIRTYGYSIENTMYCPSSLNNFVRKLARSCSDYTEDAQKWLDEFCENSQKLLIYDIANEYYGKSLKIMGDCCSRFLPNQHSNLLSKNKVDDFIETFYDNFSQKEIRKVKKLVSTCPKPLSSVIRGHFLTLAVMNWLKQYIPKKTTISKDHLFTGTVDSCTTCFKKNCEQFTTMTKCLKMAFKEVTKINIDCL